MNEATEAVHIAIAEPPGPTVEERLGLLSAVERKRCIEAARDLFQRAVRQHEEMVDWAWYQRKEHFDRNKAMLQAEAPVGTRWCVTRRREDIGPDARCDVVALTHEEANVAAGVIAVLGQHLEIMVTTQLELTGTKNNMGVAYRTRTESIANGVYGPIQQDRVVGALIM